MSVVRRSLMTAAKIEKEYIIFEDSAVEAICVEKWSRDGIGLTYQDAAAVTSIGTTFQGKTGLTSFNEFKYFTGVTSIGTNAFKNCSLVYLTLPDTIKTIGGSSTSNGAFNNEKSLLELFVPSGITSFGTGTFWGANAITRLVIGDTNASLASPQYFMNGCNNLVLLDWPAGLASINASQAMLNNMPNNKLNLVVRATTPPTLSRKLYNSSNAPKNLFVPSASVATYQATTNWSTYADVISAIGGTSWINEFGSANEFADLTQEEIDRYYLNTR